MDTKPKKRKSLDILQALEVIGQEEPGGVSRRQDPRPAPPEPTPPQPSMLDEIMQKAYPGATFGKGPEPSDNPYIREAVDKETKPRIGIISPREGEDPFEFSRRKDAIHDKLGMLGKGPEPTTNPHIREAVDKEFRKPPEVPQNPEQAGFDFDDMTMRALAQKAGEYKKPGIMEMLAVVANSLDPRQSPQGSMGLAQMLRGEPERASAERSLSRMIEGRSRLRSAEAESSGRLALEGMRQEGATGRTKIGAQAGLAQEAMRGQNALEVQGLRNQTQQRTTPGQMIDQANFHALGRINTEIGDVRQAVRAARMSMDPNMQAQIPQMEARLKELNNLKRDAVGVLHNAGVFGDEAATMFMLGEGMEDEGMDPEFLETLRSYSDQLKRQLPR